MMTTGYAAQAFPFVLPYAVGGPEFTERPERFRRTEADAPSVTPFIFTKMMACRIEGQIASCAYDA